MPTQTPTKTHYAVTILTDDHEKVKGLFEKFEETEDHTAKMKIVKEALNELKVHATIEEELFYPAVRQEVEDKEGIMDEADEEHHVAKVLIAELDHMTGKEDHWEAKFTVLTENIRHHIKEEENDMLPLARKSNIDFDALGERMWDLKQTLLKAGVPPDAEAKMIEKVGLRGDSPAKNAQKKISVTLKKKN